MEEWLVIAEVSGEWTVVHQTPDLNEAKKEAEAVYDDNRVIVVACSEIANAGIGQIFRDDQWESADEIY